MSKGEWPPRVWVAHGTNMFLDRMYGTAFYYNPNDSLCGPYLSLAEHEALLAAAEAALEWIETESRDGSRRDFAKVINAKAREALMSIREGEK